MCVPSVGSTACESCNKDNAPCNDLRNKLEISGQHSAKCKSSCQVQVGYGTLQESLKKPQAQTNSYASSDLASHAANSAVAFKPLVKIKTPFDTLAASKHILQEQLKQEHLDKVHNNSEGKPTQVPGAKPKRLAAFMRDKSASRKKSIIRKMGRKEANSVRKPKAALEGLEPRFRMKGSQSALMDSTRHAQNTRRERQLVHAAQRLVRLS
jgi:hypothetical protein